MSAGTNSPARVFVLWPRWKGVKNTLQLRSVPPQLKLRLHGSGSARHDMLLFNTVDRYGYGGYPRTQLCLTCYYMRTWQAVARRALCLTGRHGAPGNCTHDTFAYIDTCPGGISCTTTGTCTRRRWRRTYRRVFVRRSMGYAMLPLLSQHSPVGFLVPWWRHCTQVLPVTVPGTT